MVDVALPVPGTEPMTYRLMKPQYETAVAGRIVQVPLKSRKLHGVIVDVRRGKPVPDGAAFGQVSQLGIAGSERRTAVQVGEELGNVRVPGRAGRQRQRFPLAFRQRRSSRGARKRDGAFLEERGRHEVLAVG